VIRPEVEENRPLFGQRGQFLGTVHDPHREAGGVEQIDHLAAAGRVHVSHGGGGRAGQPVQVGPLRRAERGADETGRTTAPDHHAGRAGERAPQPQRALTTGGDREAEVTREDLRAVEVGLFELQPRQVGHLDQRIAGAPGVFAAQGPLLAVEVLVGCFDVGLVDVRSGHGVLQATLP
jgi:hypothetical protein